MFDPLAASPLVCAFVSGLPRTRLCELNGFGASRRRNIRCLTASKFRPSMSTKGRIGKVNALYDAEIVTGRRREDRQAVQPGGDVVPMICVAIRVAKTFTDADQLGCAEVQ